MSKPSVRVFTREFKQAAVKRIEARERLAAEDALIAALKVKYEGPDAAVNYLRLRNKRRPSLWEAR
jgi:hypothetical protein